MTNGNYKSIKSMMNRLYRYPLVSNVPEADIAQHVYDAIRLIEAPMAYHTYVEPIYVNYNRGLLPCNIIYINQTRRYSSKRCTTDYLELGVDDFKNAYMHYNIFEPMTYATDHFHTSYHEDNSPDLKKYPANVDFDNTYSIQNGYIITSFEEGMIQMSYKGLMVDEEEFPMIPDNVKVEKAIENYTRLQIYTPLWEMGKVSDKVMESLKQETAWYTGGANTSMQLQSIDQAEAFKAAFTRTLLKPLQHQSSFRNFGSQEYIPNGSI